MNQWPRLTRAGVALFLVGLLAGCDSDGGSDIDVYFGINGRGDCNGVLVDIDLEAARADLPQPIEQCVLDALLADDGCIVRFWKIDRGDTLRVTISDCEVPADSTLFACQFKEIDLAGLNDNIEARCLCQTERCDSTPPVCADTDPVPCEDCDNGDDDDRDGQIDCNDSDCLNSEACGTVTTTTSTTIPGAPVWSVTFRLAAAETVGSLQFDVDYGDTGGSIVGTGDNVQCRSLIDGALIAFNDNDAQDSLTVGLISIAGFTGPIDVVECSLQAAVEPVAADFVFSNVEASTPDSEPIPATSGFFQVSDIEFESGGSTTTTLTGATSTTSTTELSETTTTTVAPDTTTTTEPPATTTTTMAPSENYTVTYTLTAASAELAGAVQWQTNYSAATGEFQGAGAAVSCTSPISGLFAPNDNDPASELTLGVISFTGFAAPTTLATCTFNGGTEDPPVAADFVVTIQDATDVSGTPMLATIGVTVAAAP